MFRRIGIVVAVVLAGCGTESTSQSPSDPNTIVNIGPGTGYVRTAALKADTAYVKVVVNSAQDVYSEVGTYDGATDTVVAQACTTDANCSAFPGAKCYDGKVCSVKSTVNAPLYTLDTTNSALTAIQVPCNGKPYTIEVYGALALANDTEIKNAAKLVTLNEAHITNSFLMSTGCVTQDPLTNATISSVWTADNDPTTNLSLSISPIYTGLTAVPYTVSLVGANYPWTVSGWSVAYGGQATTTAPTFVGAVATFPAPTSAEITAAGASALTFSAKARFVGTLDLGVTASDKTVTKHSWQYSMAGTQKTPTSTGNVGTP